MVRLNSILRLASRVSSSSDSVFSRALMMAAARPKLPQFTPQQTVTTPATPQPQWSGGGTSYQPISSSHTPMVGYGVYSPEYLQQLELNSEPPIYGPAVPENFDSPSVDPLIFDPLNGDDIFLPVDNAAEEEPVIDEEAIEQAEDLADEIAEGRGLDLFGDSELSREDVVEQLEAGGYEVESSEWGLPLDNITRTTITDPETGETIQEFYDHDTDRSWVKVVDEDGEELSTSDVRDDEGRKITVSEDEESGERTTRLEDDWGDGSVVEITELPNSDVVTITTTDSDGNSETVVVAEDGTRTTLDPEQDTSREGTDGIAEDVSEGKNLDQIAEERGLTREQVIAQLAAAGYEVEFETDELANGGEQYTTRIVDAEDGEEVIASYSSGRGTGNSSVYIDAEGNEIRRTEYGNGTVIETVIEADGRETTTTTVAENNGEAIEYEVQDGDYLIAIAERHGVTLEELEESNPEFFDSPRDPNVIHEGETVIIEGATQTTVEVTDNGYTLTTSPDGSKTLRNNEDGKEREIAQGSVDQTLAEELLELDPSDSDDDEALQEFIEEMLMGRDEEGSVTEFEDLETALSEQEEATQEAIEEIIGEEGDESDVIKPGESSGDSDPLGPPPDEETSNGEDWVPMRHEGNWAWVDPAVAEALEEEEAARTALEQALAEVRRRQAQIGVYAHSDEIMGNVGDRLDELLAPHGLRWVAPEPKGTAEEAQENLDSANAWIDYLEAKEEYREVAEEYQALQEEADDLKERALEIYGNDEDYEDFFKEEGFEEVIERGVRSQPDETEDTGELLEQSVVERDGQLYLRNVYADRDDPLYVRLTRDPASDPYGLSDAQQDLNQEWHDLKMGDEPAQLQSDALEAFREANPDYFDPDGYSETRNGAMGSEYEWESGELTDTRVVERDGQLYVINTYGEGFSKTTKEFPITYAPGEEPEGLTQAQRDASQAWQEFTRDKDVNEDLETRILEDARERHPDYFKDEGFTETTSSPSVTQENPTGALLDQQVVERDGQLFLVNTYENLDEPLEIQLTFDPHGSGSTARTETQQQFDEDWKSWKSHRYSGEGSLVQVAQEHAEAQRTLTEKSNEQNAGYIEELEGTIPDLERELEEAIEEHGEGTVVPGGEDAEQIEIDGETRWVHPEVAAAHHDLVAARNALGEGEDILERAKELYGEQHPDHVKPGGFYESETEGNYTTFVPTGDLMGEGDDFFVGEDGQLYLRNRYEDRDDAYEFPLTYAPGEAPEGRTEAQREIDRQWADWWEEHGGDSEDPLAEATQRVSDAEEARSNAIEEYGGGTTKELTAPLPDDVEPALVMIDGEQRWVHPDVAMALGALSMVEEQIASTRVAMEAAELALEEADYRSARPSTWKLLDDAASLEHEQGVMDEWQMEDAYLDAHGSEGALTRAWQDRVESREVLLTTQIGLAEAGLSMASADGVGPDNDVTELSEALAANEALGERLAESSQWNDSLRCDSLDDRLDPEQGQERQEDYFVENPEIAEGATLDRLADLPSSVSMGNESAVRQTLGEALGTHESAVVDPVLDQLRELGGSDADVDIVPILYRDSSEGVRDTALFRVRDEDGRAWLVDESGSKYRNFEDYRQHNYLSDKGHVFLPESPNRLTDASGDLTYEWHQAREKSFTEEWLDPIIGIGTGIATVLSFTPLAPIAAPIAFAGGAYFGARSISNIHEMHEHGRPLASMEGALQGAMLATSVLPIASSGLRFAAMTSRGVDGTVAARTSIGAFNARRLQPDHPHYSPDYAHASQLLSQPGGAFAAARWSDVGAMVIGAPLLGYSSYNTAVHWDDMSGIERTDALLGVTSGIYGTGMGYRGLRASWPNQRGAREQAPPALPELNRTSAPWSTSGEFSTTTRLYPTAHMRAGSEAIDTAALQASLGGESPTPNAANHPPRAPDSLAGPFSGDMPEAAFPRISRQELAVASTDPQSVARLTSRQFSELSLFQLERFTLAQMRAIRSSQLNALSNDQLAAFTPEQVAALDPQVLGKLAPEKFASLSTRQLSNLTEDQGDALRSWQLERLSSEQRAMLPLTTRSSPQGEEVPAPYQNSPDTGARKSSLIRFRDFVWNFVQQNSVRGGDRGAFRIPFWPKKENQGAAAIREEQGLPPWVNDADLQATAALKSLSPEEIAALSGEARQSIEPWHLLLLSPEQLKAWPDPPKPTRKLSFDEWHERSRLVLLKNTALALLEPTVIRPRLAGLMGEVTPSHTEATAVFRGDTRGPDVIFLPGFQPRNPSDPHGGVSTSLSARKARWWASERANEGDTWVYTIISDISDGELFQSLPARPKNKNTPQREADINDYEVRFSQGIVGQDILSARRVDSEGNYVGSPVYNPGFKDPARLPAYLSAEALQESQTARGVDTKTERDLAVQLHPDNFSVRILGHPPKDVSNIYIQPDIGPRPRGDEAGVRHKTHILYRDPETGEAFVMPWMRGASQNHVPSAQQTTTPPQGLTRLYRLDDLDALNQASTDGTLPAGHYVHIIRSSNTGLDNATFFIDGGTVPKSGRIDENGHLRWPSSQKGQPVRLSLHNEGNGQQTVRVEDTTGSEAPREVTAKNGDVFVVISSERATETRAQIQGGGLPFALYSGNGLWSVSSNVSTSQSSTSTATPQATPRAQQQQGTTPPPSTPATQQQQGTTPSPSTPASGRVTVSTDSQGPVVQIHGLGDGWTSVVGQSSRKIWPSPYDGKAKKQALPETTLVRRSVLEQALAPEDVAKLPNAPYVRVSLVAGSRGSGQVYTAPVHATGNDSSPARRRTARGLAAALVGGSLFGMHSASAHGWTGDVLNRAASPESLALLLNGSGFVTRGTLNFFKARFDEKIRVNREALEQGNVTGQLLNWEASRIIASRRALNLNKEQVARVGTVTEEFWARYQLLRELPVNQESVQRGWTEDAKAQALKDAVSDYRTQLKEVAGEEALTVNPLDPRAERGVIFNSSILATHLVNDVVSWQYLQNKVSDGEFLKISNNLLDIAGDLGLAGFLAANVVLAGSAAVKVGTGLARVDLKSLPLINKLTGTSTATGSYFYGIMTPPWAAYTMYAAGEAIGNGHWYTAGVHLAALPFQVALSYYGIRGLRDDTISMVKSWKDGQDPGRSWPIRVLYPMTTIPMAALTGTEAYNQFAQGNHIAGTALAGGTLMQAYFIDLASRRLNWTDADVRHGPFRRLAGDNRLAADESRIWAGVGLTLTGSMLIPGALIDLRNYLEDKDLLPDWDWLVADLEGEEEPNETPVDLTDYLRDNELLPGWVWRFADSEGKKEANEPPDTKVSLGRTEQEGGSPSLEPTPRANPALEEQGHDWVEAASHLSLGGIAIKRGHDIAELVELNLSHIDDPTALRPGDRVYLPKRELA